MWGPGIQSCGVCGGVPKFEVLRPQNLGCLGAGGGGEDPKLEGNGTPKSGGAGGGTPQLRCWDPKAGRDGGGTPTIRGSGTQKCGAWGGGDPKFEVLGFNHVGFGGGGP